MRLDVVIRPKSPINRHANFGETRGAVELLRRLAPLVVFFVYPLSYFAPALRESSWIRLGDTNGDLDLAVFEVIGLKSMDFPWSRNTAIGFPIGENFWQVPGHVTQAIQWLSLWLISRFSEPLVSVTVFIVIGFITSALVAYAVARELGVNRVLATLVGVVVQVLPWMTAKAFHHTSYVFVSIPLLVVLFLIKFIRTSHLNYLGWCCGFVGLMAFFDPYWFVFSGMILVFVCLCCIDLVIRAFNEISPRKILRALILLGSLYCLLGILLLWGITSINSGTDTRPLEKRGVFDSAEIVKWTGSLSDFVTPDRFHLLGSEQMYIPDFTDKIFYGGVTVLALAAIGLVLKTKAALRRPILVVFSLSFFCAVLSTNRIEIGPLDITSPTMFLSRMTPGLRVYARFSPIAQSLWVVLAAWSIQEVSNGWRKSVRLPWLIFCGLLMLVDLTPYSPRPQFRNYLNYESFRNELALEDARGVLIPDGTLIAREISMETLPGALNSRLFNTFSAHWKVRLYPHSYTSSELSQFLRTSGVTHLVAVVSAEGVPFIAGELQDSTRFATILDPRDFEAVGSEVRTSSGERLGLFKIRGSISENGCARCVLAQWIIEPQPSVDGIFSYDPSISNSRWLGSPNFTVKLEPLGGKLTIGNHKFRVRFELLAPGGGEMRNITVSYDGKVEAFTLKAGVPREFDLVVSKDGLLNVSADSCPGLSTLGSTAPSSNVQCLGISRFLVTEFQN